MNTRNTEILGTWEYLEHRNTCNNGILGTRKYLEHGNTWNKGTPGTREQVEHCNAWNKGTLGIRQYLEQGHTWNRAILGTREDLAEGYTPKARTGRILGYVVQNQIPKAPSPPATRPFLWFPSLESAQRDTSTPIPRVTWWSQRATRAAHRWGQRWGCQGPRCGKNIFSKVFP